MVHIWGGILHKGKGTERSSEVSLSTPLVPERFQGLMRKTKADAKVMGLRFSYLSSHVGVYGGNFIKGWAEIMLCVHQVPVLGYMVRLYFPTSLAIRFGSVTRFWSVSCGRRNDCYAQVCPLPLFSFGSNLRSHVVKMTESHS